MKKNYKIDFNFFNLTDGGSEVIILKARCNEEYLIRAIDRIKTHENYGELYDIEILEEILLMDNIVYYIIEPININF